MSRGIDISHYNTCTDYAAAKAAVDWVYIKVTEGSTYSDPAAVTHYNGFAGKPRGAYHFMRGYSPSEVARFVSAVRARPWELPPMLDAEYPGVTGGAIKAFLDEYRRQTGDELTVVYASKSMLEGACNPSTFATPNTVIWAARYYANSADFATLGWDHPQLGIYQYWDKGSVPGFTGNVDLDTARSAFGPATQNGFLMALSDAQQQFILDKIHDIDATLGEVYKATGGAQTFGQSYVDLKTKVDWMYSVLGNTPDTTGDGKQGDLSLVDFRQLLVDKLTEIDNILKARP